MKIRRDPVWGPADEGAAAVAEVTPPESVLFPAEVTPEGDPAGDAVADWKEYEPDAAKSDEENAAAKAEHDAKKPAADDPLDKVPEDGKYMLTMPDGVEVDQELLDAVSPEFKDLGLTPRQAQKLTDRFVAIQRARSEGSTERWAKTVTGWAETAAKDPEMGGANWEATKLAAQRATGQLGTPALREYLDASGGGNHPEIIRFAAKVGALLKEDAPPVGGNGGAGRPAEPAHILFANDVPKG